MKTKLIHRVALLLLLSTVNPPPSALAQGTVFTYQGSLNDNGSPANGTNYGMVFYLYDAPTNGNLLGNLGIVSVSVSNGLFTVPLDFGTNFPGADRWLEMTVQKNGGGFSTLAPRQKLNPTPYAITAGNLSGSLPAVQLTGTIPASSIAGPYTSAVTLNNPANNFSGAFTGNGAGLTNIPTLGTAWQLTGNAGTAAGVNFLGTTDNQPLEFDVNGSRAFRLEPTANDASHSGIVNVVGGSPANYVAPGTYGATISGGGAANYFGPGRTNSVAADFGSIGGGENNTIQANAVYSTIDGGAQNTIQINGFYSTIGGGAFNTILNDDHFSIIGGGEFNVIQPSAHYSVIGGGKLNTIRSGGAGSTIGGGGTDGLTIQGNVIDASASTIAGGLGNSIQPGASYSTIGGGSNNLVQTNASYSTIGGGFNNLVQTNAINSTIGGGDFNIIQANVDGSVISGGDHNTIRSVAAGSKSIAIGLTIGGGETNTIVANTGSTISGGWSNAIQTNANWSTIGGGAFNIIQTNAGSSVISGGDHNIIKSDAFESRSGPLGSTIGGGENNTILVNAGATISGGVNNTIQGSGNSYFPVPFLSAYSTIGGGNNNTIQTNAGNSTISGGTLNTIKTNATYSTISGGGANTIDGGVVLAGKVVSGALGSTISGGYLNTIQTNASYATIGGGGHNTNTGNFATVPGGDQNVAGTNGFAAGHRAKATNTGTFVWADSAEADFASTGSNQFLIRASGGVGIGVNNPDAALTVNGDADKPGGGAWTVFSDARLKKNIEPLTGALNRLLELRAVTFEYKDPQSIHELPGVQIGMIAQEVEKIFPDWVDTAPNGMKRLSIHGFEALTVQALRELRAEKDAKISNLEKQLAAQKELNSQMAARFSALEKAVARLAGQPPATLAVNRDAAK